MFLEKCNLYNEAHISRISRFYDFLAQKPASKAKTGLQAIFVARVQHWVIFGLQFGNYCKVSVA